MTSIVAFSQPTVSSTSPSSQTVCSGTTATFTVTATGAAPLTYQWQVSTTNGATWTAITNNATYSGATTATLTISNTPASLTGSDYRCTVTNGLGSTSSSAGILTVNATPVAQTSSQSIVQCSSQPTGSALASNASLNYQWQVSTDNGASWNNITDGAVYTGTTTYALTWNVALSLNRYQYRFIVTDPTSGCTATSTGVDTLYIVGTPTPLVSISPVSANICPGANATFSIVDSTTLTYQWQYSTNNGATWTNTTDGSLYTGSTTDALSITGATAAAAARYHVIRSETQHGLTCSSASTFAPLALKTNASIGVQPVNATVCAGTNATFRVSATGSTPFTYIWQTDNGTSPSVWTNVGTSSSTLTDASVPTTMDGYHYQVLVTGACGPQLTSNTVTLHVKSSGVWLGGTSTAWEQAANWCGGVPVQTTNVLIPPSPTAPFQPTISAATGTAYSTALNVQSGAILTISGGSTSMLGPFSIVGTVAYTAAGSQNVLPADHGSLTIGGSGTKILQTNTGIVNTLTLGGTATLVTGNNLLTMYAGKNSISGTVTMPTAATSWIVTGNGNSGAGNTGLGGLKIPNLGSTDGFITFPVGPTPTSYAPAMIYNSGATNNFTIAVNDQVIPGGPLNATVNHTWLVSAANPSASGIYIALQWNAFDELSSFNRASASIIRGNGTYIVEEGTPFSGSGSNPYFLEEGAFSTVSQFSVATSTMVVLPVQLLSFTGHWLENGTVGLTWSTSSDFEARNFIVQRSGDGSYFDNIATVPAGLGGSSYSFVDLHPNAANFYRLQLVDADGDITYSKIVQLTDATAVDQATLAPSVTETGASNLHVTLGREADLQYNISDLSGHVLSHLSVHLPKGSNTLPLDLSRVSRGLYFVRLTSDDGFNKVLTLVKK